jgi:hypothetical protein
MASVLPFNSIKVGASEVAGPDAFIYGSGKLTLNGEDSANTTADGLIHNYRAALTPNATAEVKGDLRSIDTAHPAALQPWPAMAGSITLQLTDTRGGTPATVKAFEGIISVEYDSQTNRSSVTITGNEAL